MNIIQLSPNKHLQLNKLSATEGGQVRLKATAAQQRPLSHHHRRGGRNQWSSKDAKSSSTNSSNNDGRVTVMKAIAVNGSLLLDELDLVIQAALDGAGLAWVAEDRVAPYLASGALVRVLDDWCPPFPGFFLYYPSRRQRPAALSALIDTLRV